MREDEHAGFGQEVGVDMLRFNDGQDFAVHQIEHLFPGVGGNFLETQRASLTRKVSSGRTEPYFEELLRTCICQSATDNTCFVNSLTFEGVGGVEVDGSFLIDGQVGSSNVRRGRRSVLLGDLSSDHLLVVLAWRALLMEWIWRAICFGSDCSGASFRCQTGHSLLPRQAMRCSPEERRPTGRWG